MKKSRLYRNVYSLALLAGVSLLAGLLLPLLPGGADAAVGRLLEFAFIAAYSVMALFTAQTLRRKQSRLTFRTGAFLILASGLLHMHELADTPPGVRLPPWLGLRSALVVVGLLLMAPNLPRQTLAERILRVAVLVGTIPLGAEAHYAATKNLAPMWVTTIRPGATTIAFFWAAWVYYLRSRGRHLMAPS